MLSMMHETTETLKTTKSWSVEAVNFIAATSWASPEELSDVGHVIYLVYMLRVTSTCL
jgi:hypothetical protein